MAESGLQVVDGLGAPVVASASGTLLNVALAVAGAAERDGF